MRTARQTTNIEGGKRAEEAYQKVEDEQAAYQQELVRIEEENRLALAWWKFGSDIEPPEEARRMFKPF